MVPVGLQWWLFGTISKNYNKQHILSGLVKEIEGERVRDGCGGLADTDGKTGPPIKEFVESEAL